MHIYLPSAPGDPVLSADLDTCSEALAQLDDVIMHTFQQCVYHLTKVREVELPHTQDTIKLLYIIISRSIHELISLSVTLSLSDAVLPPPSSPGQQPFLQPGEREGER